MRGRIISYSHLCGDLSDSLLDSGGVGAANGQGINLRAILVEQEGGHGGDAVVGSNTGELVNVDLVELDGGDAVAQLLDHGRDGLAGTAPGGEEVDNDGLLAVLNELLPLLLAVGRETIG